LLQSQCKLQDSPLKGVHRTVQYLQNLGQDHLSLILQYTKWVVRENADQAFQVYMLCRFFEIWYTVGSFSKKRFSPKIVKKSRDWIGAKFWNFCKRRCLITSYHTWYAYSIPTVCRKIQIIWNMYICILTTNLNFIRFVLYYAFYTLYCLTVILLQYTYSNL